MKLIKWILLSLFTLGSTVMAAPPDAKPRLGVNLAGPADWATELPFVDVFRTSRPWISQKNGAGWGQGPELAIDEFGWVKQLQPDCYAESMLCTISDGHYPSGVYTVIYEGEGEIEFGKGPRIVDAAPGRIRIDVDSSRGGFSLQIKRTGLQATKLHFPGTMGTEDSIAFKDVMATLTAVREVVGDDKILAWDPYPGSAESATKSVDEAKQMIRLMDELGYAWWEGPLLPMPQETQIPKYVELMQMKPQLRIQAEGPNSPIGDGTSYADMVRWVEAGAVNQCSTDAYIKDGLTHAKRFLDYAKNRGSLVINLHWAWAPHAHLVMAYDDSICPIAEFPMTEDIPKEYLDGPYLLAPDWPRVYCIE